MSVIRVYLQIDWIQKGFDLRSTHEFTQKDLTRNHLSQRRCRISWNKTTSLDKQRTQNLGPALFGQKILKSTRPQSKLCQRRALDLVRVLEGIILVFGVRDVVVLVIAVRLYASRSSHLFVTAILIVRLGIEYPHSFLVLFPSHSVSLFK